jgi:hypothetical protein
MPTENIFEVDHFIELDRQSIRFQLAAGLFLCAVGGAVMLVGFSPLAVVSLYNLETVTKAGGFLVSLVGLFPFNNCWSRWERIKTLRMIKHNPAVLDAETERELVRKLYQKFLGV